MIDLDVTDKVVFGGIDGESLPLLKCVCDRTFEYWDNVISIYRETTGGCPNCGRRFYFTNKVTIYQIQHETSKVCSTG